MSTTATDYYIGLMSGTSVDGVDIALTQFSNEANQPLRCQLTSGKTYPFPPQLKQQIHQLASANYHPKKGLNSSDPIEQMAELDHQLGLFFAHKINQFINQFAIKPHAIKAIGSHGQTIRHKPQSQFPFSLQIGDANIIAHNTGITTVADFRRMDMAAGGQGAPLVPAFHQCLMQTTDENRIILNLGGIANITVLAKDAEQAIVGFDIGPANTLLDAHFNQVSLDNKLGFDRDAVFAQTGKVNQPLLAQLLSEAYFSMPPPKSTGRELFNLAWLKQQTSQFNLVEEDIQATLVALTATSIADAIKNLNLDTYQVYACGGGMHNHYLLAQLGNQLNQSIKTTNDLGVDGDYLEAMTFAWLAKRRLENKSGNLAQATGANQAKVLGGIYHP